MYTDPDFRFCIFELEDSGLLAERFSFPLDRAIHYRIVEVFQSRVLVFAGGNCSVYIADTGERERLLVCPVGRRYRETLVRGCYREALVSSVRNELLIPRRGVAAEAYLLQEPRLWFQQGG